MDQANGHMPNRPTTNGEPAINVRDKNGRFGPGNTVARLKGRKRIELEEFRDELKRMVPRCLKRLDNWLDNGTPAQQEFAIIQILNRVYGTPRQQLQIEGKINMGLIGILAGLRDATEVLPETTSSERGEALERPSEALNGHLVELGPAPVVTAEVGPAAAGRTDGYSVSVPANADE